MINSLSFNGLSFALKDYAGNSVSISGSTTSGLQELIGLCTSNGMPGKAFGGAPISGAYFAPFVLTSQLHVIAAVGLNVELIGTIRAIGMGTSNGLLIDSMDRGRFVHRGIYEYSGSGYPVHIQPGNSPTPSTPFANGTSAIQCSRIAIGNIINRNSTSAPLNRMVCIDPTYGGINNNEFEFAEVNCAAAANDGIHVISPNTNSVANSCFVQNRISSRLVVGAINAGIHEGDTTYNASTMPLGNEWDIGGITTQCAQTYGAIFWGQGSIARITSISVNGAGNMINTGIYFGAGSFGNRILCTQNEGSNKVNNASSAAPANMVLP